MCIEADGTCATSDQIIYVATNGTDSGTCTASAPCGTLTYAHQQVIGTRNVIRVVAAFLGVPATLTTNKVVTFDGSGTMLTGPTSGPLLQVTSGSVTIEGFTIVGPASTPEMPTIALSSGALRMTKSTTSTALIDATNASVLLDDMLVTTGNITDLTMVKCTSGTLTATRVAFEKTTIDSQDCALTVQQSKLDGVSDRSITAAGGKLTIENNLLVESFEFVDSMDVRGSAPGSVIRFNTFVNTSGINSGGAALICDNTQDVSNNIFAYRSTSPLSGVGGVPCGARYSLFDAVATPASRAGEGNRA